MKTVYPQGDHITCNIKLIKNACLSTKQLRLFDKAFTFPVQKLINIFSFQDEAQHLVRGPHSSTVFLSKSY